MSNLKERNSMKQLVSINTNIYYAKDEKGKETKYNELVFLLDKPEYTRSNAGDIIRQRGIEEFRFVVSEKGFAAMMELLQKLQEVTEEELG